MSTTPLNFMKTSQSEPELLKLEVEIYGKGVALFRVIRMATESVSCF